MASAIPSGFCVTQKYLSTGGKRHARIQVFSLSGRYSDQGLVESMCVSRDPRTMHVYAKESGDQAMWY